MLGRIAVVVGTRPEIIKLAPVVHELGAQALLVHSGQHWDRELSGAFFDEAGIGAPEVTLRGIGGQDRARQIGGMVTALAEALEAARPDAVVVQGDTNTTSAAAQCASYLGLPLVHVEAGLRSFDRAMPEELNRLVVGALADLHCAATPTNVDNLVREGVPASRIRLTGNTIVEATERSLRAVTGRVGLPRHRTFVLATIHRPENTDDPVRLAAILDELGRLPAPVVMPLHPRTRACVERFGMGHLLDPLEVVAPIGHEEFLGLASHAALLVSDSGGVQEECTVLKKPLIVVRNSTERPESVEAGFAHLVRPGPAIGALGRRLLADRDLPHRLRGVPSPYGDGSAARAIVAATRELVGSLRRQPA
ncbi:UDP-N-acetylglucosamine 2-epimerase (non-hydrolyzing) [Nocardioides albidus]|uniref:UDP-N-acetylglucosamine 2-epimerase (Non-hydrolyzing) n=1 Tax=Nocardioides albidus TaxID=1517589 RepID=A0A5C4VXB2_9ACTN|nr:UDP-N-acetylglucosamine 2-epimerase (non-hydrolyzing) [Nocardioides albidus]TNM40513.1 UDP-N-acetylglucosamine 2-epimerase (non-hydrolyzing) [Nocardioides albidus]